LTPALKTFSSTWLVLTAVPPVSVVSKPASWMRPRA
jgi:hypothetical protein